MDYLSEQEIKHLEYFNDNVVLKEAVRKVILSGVYRDGIMLPDQPADPLQNFILGYFTNPKVTTGLSLADKGAKLEALINGISMVESGFQELERYRKVEQIKEEPKENPAR